ncbi:LacI family DNA-binding transcriptional regulator [Actinoplanes sp. TFC3]|uniref:LacI family DNA-binding transcriptional regulator n=1 Tax=Actinoplanes sp. TFC3 TaxID=1710355 RepID=UPI000A8EAE9C|nr:LacI family DNA-binding transcriptional regulator [Actinoplanes sp. TFC3]
MTGLPRSTRRVTSADVARVAGVSRATVSYVLNDTPHQTISAATRSRVPGVAASLGYAPSAADQRGLEGPHPGRRARVHQLHRS